MKVGELIRWYEMFGDLMIVKNTGLGVILSKQEMKYGGEGLLLYKVYRPSTQDTIALEECYIEKIQGVKNES